MTRAGEEETEGVTTDEVTMVEEEVDHVQVIVALLLIHVGVMTYVNIMVTVARTIMMNVEMVKLQKIMMEQLTSVQHFL